MVRSVRLVSRNWRRAEDVRAEVGLESLIEVVWLSIGRGINRRG